MLLVLPISPDLAVADQAPFELTRTAFDRADGGGLRLATSGARLVDPRFVVAELLILVERMRPQDPRRSSWLVSVGQTLRLLDAQRPTLPTRSFCSTARRCSWKFHETNDSESLVSLDASQTLG